MEIYTAFWTPNDLESRLQKGRRKRGRRYKRAGAKRSDQLFKGIIVEKPKIYDRTQKIKQRITDVDQFYSCFLITAW